MGDPVFTPMLIGGAIGLVSSGGDVGSALKGAVLGGIGGAVFGSAGAGTEAVAGGAGGTSAATGTAYFDAGMGGWVDSVTGAGIGPTLPASYAAAGATDLAIANSLEPVSSIGSGLSNGFGDLSMQSISPNAFSGIPEAAQTFPVQPNNEIIRFSLDGTNAPVTQLEPLASPVSADALASQAQYSPSLGQSIGDAFDMANKFASKALSSPIGQAVKLGGNVVSGLSTLDKLMNPIQATQTPGQARSVSGLPAYQQQQWGTPTMANSGLGMLRSRPRLS